MVEGTLNVTLYQQSVCSTASQIPKVFLPGKVFYNFKLERDKLDIFHAGFHGCYPHDHLWSRRGSTCAVFLYNKIEFLASVLWNLLTSLTCPEALAANLPFLISGSSTRQDTAALPLGSPSRGHLAAQFSFLTVKDVVLSSNSSGPLPPSI